MPGRPRVGTKLHETLESLAQVNHEHIELLSQTVRREASVLLREPHLLASHLHNTLLLLEPEDGPAAFLMKRACEALNGRAWLQLTNKPVLQPGHAALLAVMDHGAPVRAVAWASQGNTLASAGDDGLVRTWDASTGVAETDLKGHSGKIEHLAWNPLGTLLASGGEDGTVRVWSPRTGDAPILFETGEEGIAGLAWSPDGTWLAVAGADSASIWSARDGLRVQPLTHDLGEHSALAWSPDGSVVACSGSTGDIILYDVISGETHSRIESQEGDTSVLAWDPAGEFMLSTGFRGEVIKWTLDGAKEVLQRLAYFPEALVCSPDGVIGALAGSHRTVRLFDLEHGHDATLWGHTGWIRSLSFSPGGEMVASGGDTTVRIWNVSRGFQEYEDSRQGPGRGLGHLDDRVRSVAISLDGKTVASGGGDEESMILLWDAESGAQLKHIKTQTDGVYYLAFCPDGMTLASAGLGNLVLWDVATGDAVGERLGLTSFDAGPLSLAWLPDGSAIAWGGVDGAIKLWDPGVVRPLADWEAHSSQIRDLAWSPDGSLLASGGGRAVRLWGADGVKRQELRGHSASVTTMAWTPAGDRLATADAGGSVRVWSAHGEPLLDVWAGDVQVDGLAWSPGARLLASGSSDGAVRVWDSTSGQDVAAAFSLGRVYGLQFAFDQPRLQVVDDGAASGNAPITYFLSLSGFIPPSDGF